MKKLLLIILGSTSFIGSVFADSNPAGIHFSNNTKSTIYLVSDYTSGSDNCSGKFTGTQNVGSGDDYSFHMVTKGEHDHDHCSVKLLGYLTPNLDPSSQVLEENFSLASSDTKSSNTNYSAVITSHDTPSSKPTMCPLGYSCSTTLTDSTSALYFNISDHNKYANVHFVNGDFTNPVYMRVLKADDSDCTDSVDGSYHKVDPSKSTTDYIRNTHIGKFCKYNVTIATDSKGDNAACGYDVTIGNDSNDSTYVENVDNQAVKLPTYNCFIGDDTNKFETTLTAAPIR
jgi:hypothetical protein